MKNLVLKIVRYYNYSITSALEKLSIFVNLEGPTHVFLRDTAKSFVH